MHFPKRLAKENTDAREEVLNHRLHYDLKIAPAERDYHLLSYIADVDHDGFDVILDDRDNLRKIQLKSTVKKVSVFRPEIYFMVRQAAAQGKVKGV